MTKPDLLQICPLPPDVMGQLQPAFTVHTLFDAADKNGLIAGLAGGLKAAVTNGNAGFSPALMDQLPKLKLISSLGVGYDNIDVHAAATRGIAVTNTPDVLTDDVADVALILLLGSVRRMPQGDSYVRRGEWLKRPMALTQRVGGRKAGIVGLGRIGMAIAKRAAACEVNIAWHGPRAKPEVPYPYYADLAALARDSDFLIIACPGGPATRHLVDAAVLEALGPKGWLINIARGSVVDEAALIAALRDQKIAGAGLDVFDDEPRVPEALLAFDNVVLQPHVGSATVETRRAMSQLVVDNVHAFFAGKPLLTPVL